jgi:hypothetical protein
VQLAVTVTKEGLLAGKAHLRCQIEERIFLSTTPLGAEASAALPRVPAPFVVGVGDAESKGPLAQFSGILPDAAAGLVDRCMDVALMPFQGGNHFLPFCEPLRLVEGIKQSLMCSATTHSLRAHIRWLAVQLQLERAPPVKISARL